MKGRRRDVSPHLYEPGDYGIWEGVWYCLPAPRLLASLAKHAVVEHEDGTITSAPSILVRGGDETGLIEWHGFLKRGVFTTE